MAFHNLNLNEYKFRQKLSDELQILTSLYSNYLKIIFLASNSFDKQSLIKSSSIRFIESFEEIILSFLSLVINDGLGFNLLITFNMFSMLHTNYI